MRPVHILPLLVSTAESGQSQWLPVLFPWLPSLFMTFTVQGNVSTSLQSVSAFVCSLMVGGLLKAQQLLRASSEHSGLWETQVSCSFQTVLGFS